MCVWPTKSTFRDSGKLVNFTQIVHSNTNLLTIHPYSEFNHSNLHKDKSKLPRLFRDGMNAEPTAQNYQTKTVTMLRHIISIDRLLVPDNQYKGNNNPPSTISVGDLKWIRSITNTKVLRSRGCNCTHRNWLSGCGASKELA